MRSFMYADGIVIADESAGQLQVMMNESDLLDLVAELDKLR